MEGVRSPSAKIQDCYLKTFFLIDTATITDTAAMYNAENIQKFFDFKNAL